MRHRAPDVVEQVCGTTRAKGLMTDGRKAVPSAFCSCR